MAGSCESEATQIKEQGSPESPSQEQHIPSLSIKPRSEKDEDQLELKSSQFGGGGKRNRSLVFSAGHKKQ